MVSPYDKKQFNDRFDRQEINYEVYNFTQWAQFYVFFNIIQFSIGLTIRTLVNMDVGWLFPLEKMSIQVGTQGNQMVALNIVRQITLKVNLGDGIMIFVIENTYLCVKHLVSLFYIIQHVNMLFRGLEVVKNKDFFGRHR